MSRCDAPAASRPTPKSVVGLIASDFRCIRWRDPAARGPIEIAFCYPGLHAIIWHRIAHWLWARVRWRFGGRFVSYLGRFLTGVDIHPGARIGPGFFIDHGAGVVIGETAEIGRDVTLYHGVTLGGVSWSPGKRHPTLGDRVMVGAGAKVLGPVTIGADVRVGANAVVVSDAPEGVTMVGGPARIVQREAAPSADPLRVDLDHHLMPDPVGKTLARLADRIAFLEARLAERRRAAADAPVCCPDGPQEAIDPPTRAAPGPLSSH